MHSIVMTPWGKALMLSSTRSRRKPKQGWKALGVLGGAVGVLLGLAQSGCGAEPIEGDPKSDEALGEAHQAIASTCLGGIDANGTALGPVAASTTVCGGGNKTWLCDAAGQWQYIGADCTVGNVPPVPTCSCLGGSDANGTALGPVACSTTICGGGNKTWLCNASGQWQSVGANCSVGPGPIQPTVGCSGGSLADGTPLGLISANTTVCGGGFTTWLCDASLQWQHVGADCSVASCSNGVLDPGEIQTDCGGACLCASGQFCLTGANCASGSCSSNVCTPACVPGAVQSQTCSGYALTQVVYTSVNCATATQLVQACSAQCGAPPAGQQLGAAFCSGADLYASFTNGSCGASNQLVQANAPQCGGCPGTCFESNASGNYQASGPYDACKLNTADGGFDFYLCDPALGCHDYPSGCSFGGHQGGVPSCVNTCFESDASGNYQASGPYDAKKICSPGGGFDYYLCDPALGCNDYPSGCFFGGHHP